MIPVLLLGSKLQHTLHFHTSPHPISVLKCDANHKSSVSLCSFLLQNHKFVLYDKPVLFRLQRVQLLHSFIYSVLHPSSSRLSHTEFPPFPVGYLPTSIPLVLQRNKWSVVYPELDFPVDVLRTTQLTLRL